MTQNTDFNAELLVPCSLNSISKVKTSKKDEANVDYFESDNEQLVENKRYYPRKHFDMNDIENM